MISLTKNKLLVALPHNYIFFDVEEPYTILEISDHFLKVMGLTREQITGKPLFEAFPDNPASNARQLVVSFKKVLETKEKDSMPVVRYDLPIPGTSKLAERYWKPDNHPYIEDGEVKLIIHTAIDVTDLRRVINNE